MDAKRQENSLPTMLPLFKYRSLHRFLLVKVTEKVQEGCLLFCLGSKDADMHLLVRPKGQPHIPEITICNQMGLKDNLLDKGFELARQESIDKRIVKVIVTHAG